MRKIIKITGEGEKMSWKQSFKTMRIHMFPFHTEQEDWKQ